MIPKKLENSESQAKKKALTELSSGLMEPGT